MDSLTCGYWANVFIDEMNKKTMKTLFVNEFVLMASNFKKSYKNYMIINLFFSKILLRAMKNF